ncbi:aconitate hydratase AcnA [Microbaculum marinisediminis]|uniref:Aconitate hydratase n=1 Tax=Microbaculum marinisediminis TaxID=2931392 RepID=A0AAW5R056_9HYPH|nr:aconitate hydratase AcnA [Microbaculum sp. A6E488]MCT8973676.1 aconitate hydratase AcnA [Microbaculum sp. A6E488]
MKSLPADGRDDLHCVDLDGLTSARATPLPRCLLPVLENIVVQSLNDDGNAAELAAVAGWSPGDGELVVTLAPNRVMFPDSSGLPALLDLAAARDHAAERGLDPAAIEPVIPVQLVIDHSLIVDSYGRRDAIRINERREFERNRERYAFFKWAEQAFRNLTIVPPGSGIIHQVHLEKLAELIVERDSPAGKLVQAEFVIGCDSHTTMINAIGLLAWGVGGIDGEMAALGQPYSVRIPRIVGVRLKNRLATGAMPTDLVLAITKTLREHDVVGAFVEFFGEGLDHLPVPDRATIANMAPEYGATVGFFPIDAHTLAYLRQSGRPGDHVRLVEAHARATGMFREAGAPDAEYSEVVEIDLAAISPAVAGPRRPQDLVPLAGLKDSFRNSLTAPRAEGGFDVPADEAQKRVALDLHGTRHEIGHGAVTVAAITSCTNTSNPTVMIAAGLLARNAVARGLTVPPWVKTSLAPGSRLVTDYLSELDLMPALEDLGFHLVGYGCTTCSGKSGPIDPAIMEAVADGGLVAASVLSGNRNFEGRIHKSCRANYLASPPLVVAFALAGRVDIDFDTEPLGHDRHGEPVFLHDLWPAPGEIEDRVSRSQNPDRFRSSYASVFEGSPFWTELPSAGGVLFPWDRESTYIKRPPFFELEGDGMPDRIRDGRVLVMAGDFTTTDHVTPSGEILADSLAGRYLVESGVAPKDFNAVTQRRGNHEFMARITFANQRMRNLLVPDKEGGVTRLEPQGDPITIYEAAETMRNDRQTPIVIAGRSYGMGSSRDWAAKGPMLLGVRVVLAVSFERIHRSNLISLGILPLCFKAGETADTLGLSGFETFEFSGIRKALEDGTPVTVTANRNGEEIRFEAVADVASAHERDLLLGGGVFRKLIASMPDAPHSASISDTASTSDSERHAC